MLPVYQLVGAVVAILTSLMAIPGARTLPFMLTLSTSDKLNSYFEAHRQSVGAVDAMRRGEKWLGTGWHLPETVTETLTTTETTIFTAMSTATPTDRAQKPDGLTHLQMIEDVVKYKTFASYFPNATLSADDFVMWIIVMTVIFFLTFGTCKRIRHSKRSTDDKEHDMQAQINRFTDQVTISLENTDVVTSKVISDNGNIFSRMVALESECSTRTQQLDSLKDQIKIMQDYPSRMVDLNSRMNSLAQDHINVKSDIQTKLDRLGSLNQDHINVKSDIQTKLDSLDQDHVNFKNEMQIKFDQLDIGPPACGPETNSLIDAGINKILGDVNKLLESERSSVKDQLASQHEEVVDCKKKLTAHYQAIYTRLTTSSELQSELLGDFEIKLNKACSTTDSQHVTQNSLLELRQDLNDFKELCVGANEKVEDDMAKVEIKMDEAKSLLSEHTTKLTELSGSLGALQVEFQGQKPESSTPAPTSIPTGSKFPNRQYGPPVLTHNGSNQSVPMTMPYQPSETKIDFAAAEPLRPFLKLPNTRTGNRPKLQPRGSRGGRNKMARDQRAASGLQELAPQQISTPAPIAAMLFPAPAIAGTQEPTTVTLPAPTVAAEQAPVATDSYSLAEDSSYVAAASSPVVGMSKKNHGKRSSIKNKWKKAVCLWAGNKACMEAAVEAANSAMKDDLTWEDGSIFSWLNPITKNDVRWRSVKPDLPFEYPGGPGPVTEALSEDQFEQGWRDIHANTTSGEGPISEPPGNSC